MKNTTKTRWVLLAALAIGAGCDEGMTGTDAGTDGGGAGGDPTCANYCANVTANCEGANAQYADSAECMEICTAAGWAAGEQVTSTGPLAGNTIACRQYHGGDPAADDPDMHCIHAGETGGEACGSLCEAYCSLALGVCTGADELYANGEECMTACAAFDDSGTAGATSGDTIQCRLYHLGVAIREDMRGLHCPHAGPDGAGVCVGPWTFNTTDPTDYTRVDRMGMPAVATALVSSGMKNAYNDGSPTDDAAGTFVAELTANLTALHTALDDDLVGAGLTPCVTAACLAQEIAPGVSVASLVVPDDLTIDTSATAGFPNGRMLADPVIDVTLSIILLDVDTTPGPAPHTPTTLVGVLDVTANDVANLTAFPYFALPHEP